MIAARPPRQPIAAHPSPAPPKTRVAAITPVGELSFGLDVRDLAFWDEATVLLVTPAGDLWRAVLEPSPRATERLYTGREVNASLAKAFGEETMEPASGGYPSLAADARAGVAIVNTHDVVLVACAVPADARPPAEPPKLIAAGWGNYYPQLSFSADGSRFAAAHDELLVFDTRTWARGQPGNDSDAWAWHPREPRMLSLDDKDRLSWVDFSDVKNPVIQPLGTLDTGEGDDRTDPHALLVDADGAGFLVAYHYPPRLEWWRMDPLRRIGDARPAPDGEVFGIHPSPAGDLLALLSSGGVRLMDAATREEVSDVMEGAMDLSFSPSGRRFITRSLAMQNPHPKHGGRAGARFHLWQAAP